MAAEDLSDKKSVVTFRQFIEEIYLSWYKTQVKESTYLNRQSTIQKHFACFYKKPVGGIEPLDVQNCQLKLAKQFNPNDVRIVQEVLSLSFDRAVVLGPAKKNPSRMIGNIKAKKSKLTSGPWTNSGKSSPCFTRMTIMSITCLFHSGFCS